MKMLCFFQIQFVDKELLSVQMIIIRFNQLKLIFQKLQMKIKLKSKLISFNLKSI